MIISTELLSSRIAFGNSPTVPSDSRVRVTQLTDRLVLILLPKISRFSSSIMFKVLSDFPSERSCWAILDLVVMHMNLLH